MPTTLSLWQQPRRVAALATASAMLLQAASPVFAAVSQNPPTYVAQPDPNVMFTLDDSLSMLSDAIPDIFTNYQGGMPSDANSEAVTGWGARFPNLWKSDASLLTAANYSASTKSTYLSATYYNLNNGIARYFRSSAGNPLYYNPQVKYDPWPDAANNNTLLSSANVAAVNIHPTNPFDQSRRIDLTQQMGPNNARFWPATYFVYNGTTPMPLGQWNNPQNTTPSSFTKYEITGTVNTTFPRHANRTDCTGAVGPNGCTRDQERQNFANWLQYYRTRMLMTKGGIADAFARQLTNLRVGFGTINTSGVVRSNQGVRQFNGQRRTDFFTDLYGIPASSGGTPLRRAMDDVGRYFSSTGTSNPYAYVPGTTLAPEYSCRRSFHILSTDGYWNQNPVTLPVTPPATQDQDNLDGRRTPPTVDGTRFIFTDTPIAGSDPQAELFAVSPFNDANGTSTANATLSDIAAYYWATDLRGLANNVPPSRRDPAYWQHLTTFTVGLGINGSGLVRRASDPSSTFTVPNSEPADSPFYSYRGLGWLSTEVLRDLLVARKVSMDWTTATSESPETGDDLIRAAMVGRGRYFSATNPVELSNGLTSALLEATDTPLSQSNLAVWAQELRADNKVYQATFSPLNWYGRLYSFNQGLNGRVNPEPTLANWEASNRMPLPGDRSIFTWNSATSAASMFTWAGLSTTQQGHLNNDPLVLNYLRGDSSREIQNGGGFRDRSRYLAPGGSTTPGVLGDIVNSSPVKGMLSGASYQLLPSTVPGYDSYAAYRSTAGNPNMANLTSTLFVGANDGMLHAFNSNTGVERFAFVPNSVFNVPRSLSGSNERKLLMLSQPTYQHRYTVDGSPQLADAFLNNEWRTMLVGTTGAGARSIFAMDVSNPVINGSTSGFGVDDIKWEFSEADATHGADMGHVLSYGHVARMANGQWAVIFGNGYDSATGRAALFILDLWTGAVIRKIPVGPTPGLTARKNGLSQPNFTMYGRTAQYIYAGDLYGNLWKFDVTSANPALWAPSFGSGPEYSPLYTTPGNQPITVMPALGLRVLSATLPDHRQPMVIFGTGQFWDTDDTNTSTTLNINLSANQAIYGIWDKMGETTGLTGLTSLLQQQFTTAAATAAGFSGTTDHPIDFLTHRGWYLSLRGNGERVHVNPQLPNPNDAESPVFLVANTPAAAVPCTGGGSGSVLALNPYSGRLPSYSVFDADRSDAIDEADLPFNVFSTTRGILTTPVFQAKGGDSGAGGSTTPPPLPEPTTDAQFYGDGRGGANAGGREDAIEGSIPSIPPCGPDGTPPPAAIGNLAIGVTDTSIITQQIGNKRITCTPTSNTGGGGPPRISWRQIQ